MPMPIPKRPSVSTDSECASHAVVQAGRTGEAYTQVPTRLSTSPARGALRVVGGQVRGRPAGGAVDVDDPARCHYPGPLELLTVVDVPDGVVVGRGRVVGDHVPIAGESADHE